MELYKNIKKRRLALNLSQNELAHRMGYADRSMVCKVEAGKVDLSQKRIMEFAIALKTTPETLMGWEDEKNKPINKDELREKLLCLYDAVPADRKQSVVAIFASIVKNIE